MATGRIVGIASAATAAVALAAGAAAMTSSCQATPTNIPVRSFQQARDVDYLCIAYNDPKTDVALDPTLNVGLNPNLCTQVPNGITGSTLDNHLLALVTQAARGEVAVVDVTSGNIVDESHDTPGINFIPVGASPSGIVVAPDAQMTFVSSADKYKPAIYAIPTTARAVPLGASADAGVRTIAGVLGDSTYPSSDLTPLQITDLPACALPQPPQSIAIEPISPQQGGPPSGYVLVAVLQSTSNLPARVVTIDPTGLLRGFGLDVPDAGLLDGGTVADGGDAGDGGVPGAPAVTPGILAECPVLGITTVAGQVATTWTPGPPWADGVPYADAGDLASQEPSAGPGCTAPEAGAPALAIAPGAQADPSHMVMRDDLPLLYVGDAQLPVIHVFDVSNPAHPVEQAPLLATSLDQPTRPVTVGAMAMSPVTRNYQRFLYAVDSSDGSVMVYDVTDPATSPRTPLLRPHAELNPLAPRDRLAFASPVATVGFATHDWPVIPPGTNGTNPDQINASTGLLCNPNPNASPDAGGNIQSDASAVLDNGYFYTATQVTVPYPAGTVQTIPLRLRGVFGFVTLLTGQVVTIDVDDWDAPCRRPDPMAIDPTHNFGMTGLLDLPESPPGPPGSPTFLDPYSAPFPEPTNQTSSVTQEAFFPVSAPNRMRSSELLRNDPTAGDNAPNLVAFPALTDVAGAPVQNLGSATVPPLLLPTALAADFIDPSRVTDPTDPPAVQTLLPDASALPGVESSPGIRLSFDDPTATQNQAWTVAYEGAIPTLVNIAADIVAPGADAGTAYQTLTLTVGQQIPGPTGAADAGFPATGFGAGFCERGVEDWDIGKQRAQQVLDALAAANLPAPPNLTEWTGDYVEILDDPQPQGDPYWNVKNSCWDGVVAGKVDLSPVSGGSEDPQPLADARYNACNQAFGTGAPDSYLGRDLPILKAYDDHVDVGRFYWDDNGGTVAESTTNRTIVGQDPSNVTPLRFVSCCFQNQATFKVRAGGEWLAVGLNGVGYLHHVVAATASEADPLASTQSSRRCVLSCDPHDVLLNSRSFDIPWTPIPWGTTLGEGDAGALAMADGGPADAGVEAGAGALTCQLGPDAAKLQILRTSPLAFQNPFFSYVTWMGCGLPATRFDHSITPRDDTWRFQIGGGFVPLTISLTSNSVVDISPQSMRYIQPLGWLAVVDGQSQGLELIDLNAVAVVHNYY